MSQENKNQNKLDEKKLLELYKQLYKKYKDLVDIGTQIIRIEKNADINDLTNFFVNYMNEIIKEYNGKAENVIDDVVDKNIIQLSVTNNKIILGNIPDNILEKYNEFITLIIQARAIADYIRCKKNPVKDIDLDELRTKTAIITHSAIGLFNLLILILLILECNLSYYSNYDADVVNKIRKQLMEMTIQLEPFLCNSYKGYEYLGCCNLIAGIREQICEEMSKNFYDKSRKIYEEKMRKLGKKDDSVMHI